MSLRSYCVPLDPNSHLYRSLPVLILPFTPIISVHHLFWHCLSHFPHRPPLFFFKFPCKTFSFPLHQAWIVTRVLPATTPPSIHYPFIAWISSRFSFVYICMETLALSVACRAHSGAFTISHFFPLRLCSLIVAHHYCTYYSMLRAVGRLCRANPFRQLVCMQDMRYALLRAWIQRVWWWTITYYLLVGYAYVSFRVYIVKADLIRSIYGLVNHSR